MLLEFQEKHGTNGRDDMIHGGMAGLKNLSRKPHNIKIVKITKEIELIILELRLYNRFGPMRIRFRLKRKYGISLGTKTIYRILKRFNLCTWNLEIQSRFCKN